MRIVYALIVSITRGIQYALLDKVLVSIPVVVLCFFSSIFNTIFFWIIFYLWNYATDFKKYFSNNKIIRLFALVTVLYLISSSLILVAIKNKNATIASLIEISYPIFVILFTYLFYKNINLNWQTILWWTMILWWIVLVYLFNK